MLKNSESFFLYFISLMCFGVFVFTSNMELIEKIIYIYSKNNIEAILISILVGTIFTLLYIIVLGIINSWILNIAYILSYKSKGFQFVAYNFFPIIYIKDNRKFKISFNILLLYEIGSMVSINDKINNEDGLIAYLENTKKVYVNLIYTHFILIGLGVLVGIFNFGLGGMVVAYNIAIILFQTIENKSFWGPGYIYLSKNLDYSNIIYTIINLMKVQNFNKDFIYSFFQNNIMCDNTMDENSNIILDEFYQTIMIDSISGDFNYLNIEINNKIEKSFKQQTYFNSFEFLNHYRLYRLYCIYILKFYGVEKYKELLEAIDKFYIDSKSMAIIKNMKLFENDKESLKNYRFKELDLRNKFDICNKFDVYTKKLCCNLLKRG